MNDIQRQALEDIDPDWRDHFPSAEIAIEYYINDAISNLQAIFKLKMAQLIRQIKHDHKMVGTTLEKAAPSQGFHNSTAHNDTPDRGY